jgi:hypothetical protein
LLDRNQYEADYSEELLWCEETCSGTHCKNTWECNDPTYLPSLLEYKWRAWKDEKCFSTSGETSWIFRGDE